MLIVYLFRSAAVAHHPSFLGLPDDVEPVAKPLAVTVGDKDRFAGFYFILTRECGRIKTIAACSTRKGLRS